MLENAVAVSTAVGDPLNVRLLHMRQDNVHCLQVQGAALTFDKHLAHHGEILGVPAVLLVVFEQVDIQEDVLALVTLDAALYDHSAVAGRMLIDVELLHAQEADLTFVVVGHHIMQLQLQFTIKGLTTFCVLALVPLNSVKRLHVSQHVRWLVT